MTLGTLAALVSLAVPPATIGSVVLSRHTGEVVTSSGDARAALPVDAMLGPFRAAGSLERWTPVLRALGIRLGGSDGSPAQASPLALANAYRLLAEVAHLEGLHEEAGGVVWTAVVDADLVSVAAVRPGRTEPSLPALDAPPARDPAREAARVQVFGLLPAGSVRARCARGGYAVGPGGPTAISGEVPLDEAARKGALVCVGAPWLVRVPGAPRPRAYAGVFTLDPVAKAAAASTGATPREARARRGADLVFRTTRLLYAAGVVGAEDVAVRGAAREALALVADANGRLGRHPGRPPCDTTHCQAFLGTGEPRREERTALERPLLATSWLPFSRGGHEPWSQARPTSAVERALGPGARSLSFGVGRVRWVEGATPREAGCEVLRGPLDLPACPSAAATRGDEVLFTGRGVGHGEGLDVEAAKRSGLSADAIVERAYGPELARREGAKH